MALTYIINGKIVLPDSVKCDKSLAFDEESGKIYGVVDSLPDGVKVIDAKGNYVAPGLVDIHIHGYLGEDTSDAKPEGIKKMAYGVAKNGVTAFLPRSAHLPCRVSFCQIPYFHLLDLAHIFYHNFDKITRGEIRPLFLKSYRI